MTPKEKAKEIYDDMKGFRVKNTHRKKCSLVCVDKILNCDSFFKTLDDSKEFTKYWYNVQEEISKL